MSTAVDAPSPAKLAEIFDEYLPAHPAAVLLEDGMRLARYSVTESDGRCLIQFSSDQRNLIRTVLEIQRKAHSRFHPLNLPVLRLLLA